MTRRSSIDLPRELIADFCRRNHIRTLALFGSVLRDDFRPDSDVDVLVEFDADARYSLLDLVRIQDELQTILGRPVDLVEKAGLQNPFRRHAILKSLEVIYAS